MIISEVKSQLEQMNLFSWKDGLVFGLTTEKKFGYAVSVDSIFVRRREIGGKCLRFLFFFLDRMLSSVTSTGYCFPLNAETLI